MYFPDLIVEVSSEELGVLMPVNGRHLHKSFTSDRNGITKLTDWLRDLGMHDCCIRIRIANPTLIALAVSLAVRLSMASHAIGLTVGEQLRHAA